MKTAKTLKILTACSVVFIMIFGVGSFSSAQDTEEKSWEWRIVPLYAWFASLDGKAGIKDTTGDVDLDFGEIFDKLQLAYMGHVEGIWRQKIGVFGDLVYLSLGEEKTLQGIPTKVDLKQTIGELGGFYRLGQGPHFLDLLASLRYYDLKLEPTVGARSLDRSADWLDGVVGLQWRWKFAEKWILATRGDIGAGGSELAWNLSAFVDWQVWKNLTLLGGYRALDIDYKDKFTYDVTIQGPVLGFSFVW